MAFSFEACTIAEYNREGKAFIKSWAARDFKTMKPVAKGDSIDAFFDFISKGNYTIYFHDLKFAGSYILYYLLEHGYKFEEKAKNENTFQSIISEKNVFYEIKIHHKDYKRKVIYTTIFDTMKKFPFTIRKLAEMLNLSLNDVEDETFIMCMAAKNLNEGSLNLGSIGKDAINQLTGFIGEKAYKRYFPNLTTEEDDFCREAYTSGYTGINEKKRGKIIQNVYSFDENSAYAFHLLNNKMPVGSPTIYVGPPPDGLFIHEFIIDAHIKAGKLPTFKKKGDSRYQENEYIKDTKGRLKLTMSTPDYNLMLENYEIDEIEHIGGYAFKSKAGIFDDYVKYFYGLKLKNDDNPAFRKLFKSYLTHLAASVGRKSSTVNKIPYIDAFGLLRYLPRRQIATRGAYVPIPVFMNAYNRVSLIKTAERLEDRFLYSDTDSIKTTDREAFISLKPIGENIGEWKEEEKADEFIILRQKVYAAKYGDQLKITCAGLTEEVKRTFTTFEDLENYVNTPDAWQSNIKLKNVKGGYIKA